MSLTLNDFTSLKEIQSLDNMIKKHLDAIQNEEGRKEHILGLRQKRESEKVGFLHSIQENSALISKLEKELFEWEKKKEQAEVNQSRAIDQKQAEALEKEINQVIPKCAELEDEILNLLEENEQLQESADEADVFLNGSKKTLDEISQEILEETTQERKQIHNYEQRIELLIEKLPKELKDAFFMARDKYRFKLPLARTVNRACEQCRFQVDSQTLSLVDQARIVAHCQQCERLLIPFDA